MSTVLPDLLDARNRDEILNDLQQKKFGYYEDDEPLNKSKASTVYFTKETDKDFKKLGNYKNMYFDHDYNIVITFKPLDLKLYILNSNILNVIDYLNNVKDDIRFHLKNVNDTSYTEVKLYTEKEKNDYKIDANRIGDGGARNKSKKQLKKVKKTKKRTRKQRRKQRSKRMFSIK